MSSKRKRVVLSVEQKVEILKRLKKNESQKGLAEEFGVGTSTISDIKKQEGKLLDFARKLESSDGSLKRKVMRLAADNALDEAVYLWFTQMRSQGATVSGPLLMEQARILNKKLNGEDSEFKASQGWLTNFQCRHGIRHLGVQGRKLFPNNRPHLKDQPRRNVWIQYCKRKHFVPARTHTLCSRHFSKDAYDRYPALMATLGYENAKPRLKPDAVPDILLEIRPRSKSNERTLKPKRERGSYRKRIAEE